MNVRQRQNHHQKEQSIQYYLKRILKTWQFSLSWFLDLWRANSAVWGLLNYKHFSCSSLSQIAQEVSCVLTFVRVWIWCQVFHGLIETKSCAKSSHSSLSTQKTKNKKNPATISLIFLVPSFATATNSSSADLPQQL